MTLRRYVLKRLGLAVVTLFGVLVAVFVLTHLLPGNPALVKLGAYATPEAIKAMEQQMGLDKPLPVQFVAYLGHLAHGNLGDSWTTGRPVTMDLGQRIPATLEMAFLSLILATAIGFPLGVFAALRKGRWPDRLYQVISISGASAPVFWLSLMMIYVFYFKLHWAPTPTGRLDDFMQPPAAITHLYIIDSLLSGDMEVLRAAVAHLLLPASCLAFITIAPISKMARAAMGQVLQEDYIQTARAIGLSERRWVIQDAVRNALIPVITMLGIVLGYLMAGTVLVERIFAWPGIGIYAWNALLSNDFDAIQGFVLVVSVSYVCINLVVDLLYSVVDPRVRLQ